MFIDTHAHLFKEYYDDINDVVQNAKESDINLIITAGVDNATNKEVLDTVKIDEVYGCIGIHPEYANDYKNDDIFFIENNLSNSKIVAIGEIGLDYHYEGYNKERQIELFETQLALAEKYSIPVVIHSREATLDTINTLKKYKVTGVIHSFSGSKETAKEYIKMGFMLGINGVVTFKNAGIKDVIKELGLEHFVLETDSPYLTPVPYRGKTNYPAYVKNIAEFLSEYLCVSLNDISRITNTNVYSVFKNIKG